MNLKIVSVETMPNILTMLHIGRFSPALTVSLVLTAASMSLAQKNARPRATTRPQTAASAAPGITSVVVRDAAWDAEMNQRAVAMGCQAISGNDAAARVEPPDAPPTRISHRGAVSLLAVAPDGASAYSVSADDGNVEPGQERSFRIRRWNVATGEIVKEWAGHQEPIHSLQVTSDGQQLVSAADDGFAKIWRLPEGTLERSLQIVDVPELRQEAERRHEKDFRPPRWKALLGRTPDELLACGEESVHVPGLGLWSLSTGQCREMIFYRQRFDMAESGEKYSPNSVALSPNGEVLAVSCPPHLETPVFLNPLDRKYLEVLKPPFPTRMPYLIVWPEKHHLSIPIQGAGAMAFSPDGTLLAMGWNGLSIWSLPERRFVWQVTPDEIGAIISLAISFDGQQILTGTHDGVVRVWSARDGRLLKETRFGPAPITAITPVADGRGFLIGNGFGHVVFWCQYDHIIVRYFYDVKVETERQQWVYIYDAPTTPDRRMNLKTVTRVEELPVDTQYVRLIPKQVAEEWVQQYNARGSGGTTGSTTTYTDYYYYTTTVP